MARPKTSLIRRILVQTDCSSWCIHDHIDVFAVLILPTLAAFVACALVLVGVLRMADVSPAARVLIVGFVAPFAILSIFTALPLPCAVFAWKNASGEPATAADCFAFCWRRAPRLLGVFVRLALIFAISLPLFGIPLLWLFPRTCLTPLVALFENERRIFRRSSRILREDFGVPLMFFLYLAMGIALSGLVILPRIFVTSDMLGYLFDAGWRPAIVNLLWIFETTSVAILLTAIVMSWWVSLTLVYHDIRRVREGEYLKRRIAAYRAMHAV